MTQYINYYIELISKGRAIYIRGHFTRQTIWRLLLACDEPIGAKELIQGVDIGYDVAKRWLDVWSEKGYAKKIIKNSRHFNYLAINKRKLAPDIDLKGNTLNIEKKQYIWAATRELKTKRQLITPKRIVQYVQEEFNVAINPSHVKSYLTDLSRGFYVRPIVNMKPTEFKYRMLYDTGEIAPSVLDNKTIFDHNLGIITYEANSMAMFRNYQNDIVLTDKNRSRVWY